MKWEAEGIDFGEIGKEPRWEEGYQKTDLVKRARAFENIFVPLYSRKIVECEETGNYKLAQEYYKDFRKKFKAFLKIVISHENAKAYFIMQSAAISFIKKIGIPIKEHMNLIRI